MVILSAKDITKTYGVDTILENVSFHVNEGDRIGIVGANGASNCKSVDCIFIFDILLHLLSPT